MRKRLLVFFVLFELAHAGCRPPTPVVTPQDAGDPSIDLLADPVGQPTEESWAIHTIRGAKVGYRHTRLYRHDGNSEPMFQIVVVDRLELRRFGDVVVQELTTSSFESADGSVRQLAYQVISGQSASRATGVVDHGELTLTRSIRDEDADEIVRFAWSDQQRGIFAIQQALRHLPMKPGERRKLNAFLPLVDRLVTFELVAHDEESVEVGQESRQLLRIESVDPRVDSWKIPTIYWTDVQGRIIKSREAFLNRETTLADEAAARQPNNRVRVDLGVDVGVPIEQRIANPLEVKYAVYRVQVSDLSPQSVFPVSLSQRVLPAEEGVALVTVSQVTPDQPASVDVKQVPPQPEDLAPNALVQSTDLRVMAIAESVAGSVEDPWFAAQLLERHVFSRLSKEDFSQVFSSAAEVAERRRGDCSEHAVLLAAICRAHGIPARVAIGLLYSDEDRSFLYHMWNEVWIKDRWVPLDATLGKGGVGGCHLKLRDSNLARQTAYDMVSPVIHLIGRIKIEVIATRRSPP